MSTNREDVLAVLKGINAPGGDIVSSGVMRALTVDGGTIRFVMEINPSQAVAFETVKSAAEGNISACCATTPAGTDALRYRKAVSAWQRWGRT